MNKIYLESKSFTYPDEIERKQYSEKYKKFETIEVEYIHTLISMHNYKLTFEEAQNLEDINWCYNCFINRLNKLSQSHLYLITHYNRSRKNENLFTDKYLFEYYNEIFYYYYYSVRDIIAQLINEIEDLKIKESDIYINKLIPKIKDKNLRKDFSNFCTKTNESYKVIRNAFNHRFSPNINDNRSKITDLKKDNVYEFGFPKSNKISNKEFYEDTELLMNELHKLIPTLNRLIQKRYTFLK